MSRAAYQRAERCFALARSTTFAGERDSAIAKGTAIAEKAGLDLDLFEIPGRARRRVVQPERLFEGNGIFGDGYHYVRAWSGVSVDELIRDINAMYEAANRQSSACDRERERRIRQQWRVDSAVNFLRGRGNAVVSYADGTYTIDGHHRPGAHVPGEVVIMAAQSRGWKG